MTIEIEGRVREAGSGGGLQNVCVSNGEHVVRTGAGGRYELKIEPGEHRFVWVTVPDGFRLPADFYHSTRDWDASRRDVDFDLVPAPGGESRNFRLAHVTDTHVGAVGYRMTGEIVQGDLQDLIGEAAPDLIVVTGRSDRLGGRRRSWRASARRPGRRRCRCCPCSAATTATGSVSEICRPTGSRS